MLPPSLRVVCNGSIRFCYEAEDELDFEEYCDINDVDMTDLGEFNDTVSSSSEAAGEMTVSLTEKFQVKESLFP